MAISVSLSHDNVGLRESPECLSSCDCVSVSFWDMTLAACCLTVDVALCDSARLHVCLRQVYMNVMIRICIYLIWYSLWSACLSSCSMRPGSVFLKFVTKGIFPPLSPCPHLEHTPKPSPLACSHISGTAPPPPPPPHSPFQILDLLTGLRAGWV
ncbi:unnamed protein product [Pipistrellus nathusii]|uniref:Uncharacterized protein n=1 Tax=Pipistrellus nathusii TaxID=59473 RepID=A0ABP0AHJ8_PIPNA